MDDYLKVFKYLALITHKDDTKIHFKTADGLYGNFINLTRKENGEEYVVDDVIYIDDSRDYVEEAPRHLWKSTYTIGIVIHKTEDLTIIDQDGRYKIANNPNHITFEKGSTVILDDNSIVLEVISNTPIQSVREIKEEDEDQINSYETNPKNIKENFDDFGGLPTVVNRAKELIETSIKRKIALDNIGTSPIKGVLFTGDPGAGKTMLARIIAKNVGAKFYEIKGPEILSKWVGDSEKTLRNIFAAAKQQPSVIFIDELDSIASQRTENLHESSKKLVAQLLTLMDGFDQNTNVIVVATTNRPNDIDNAFRRPGRFDWEIYFPKPAFADRLDILQKSSQSLALFKDFSSYHKDIASQTEGWSASEIVQIWNEAGIFAAKDDREEIIAEDYFEGFRRVQEYLKDKNEGLA